ncbi:hypothetical protein L4D76_23915 [Photobacterium sagamiensis]|uniref:hypothetical protein n=1 Tax=Photobacterium sagamiensis TaxID=2910241 RepID=UPI003D0F1ED2
MVLLNDLFGKNQDKTTQTNQKHSTSKPSEKISYHDDFIEISSINFFGQYQKSDSGEWVICWSDSDPQQQTGGYRESGFGRYVLYNAKQEKIVLQGKLERPNSGYIANNGIFSIEDWHFGNDLSGTFYVFAANGDELIKRKFEANIFNSSISDGGRYAICQTANNPESEDGNLLSAFDVEKNTELFSINPTTDWADSYDFIEDTPYFTVVIDEIGSFRYDKEGAFVDAEKYDAAQLCCDRFDTVLLTAEEILKEPEPSRERVKLALEAILRARSLGADENKYWKGIALKVQGLAHELLDNKERALEAFDEALTINPKIGVKRKADSLRKMLAKKDK